MRPEPIAALAFLVGRRDKTRPLQYRRAAMSGATEDDTRDTTEDSDDDSGAARGPSGPGHALVIAWSRDEPGRVGQLVAFPMGLSDVLIIGRGDEPEAGAGTQRAAWVSARPGQLDAEPPLGGARISRRQLRVQRVDHDTLAVENLGRRGLIVRGQPAAQATIRHGDTLEIEGELLLVCVERAATVPSLLHLAPDRAQHPFGGPDVHGLVGESPAMWRLRDAIALAARDEAHVLVVGGDGVGKEFVARAVHASSARGAAPAVVRDVALVEPEELGAALFGEGAEPGMLAEARASSLILHEIGPVADALSLQLGRFLDTGHDHRLAERNDARVIASTTTPLTELPVQLRSRFRHIIVVPPLDERREDIAMLASELSRRALAERPELRARFFGPAGPRLSVGLVARLIGMPFSGGIRELDALLWRAITWSSGEVITVSDALEEALSDVRVPSRGPTRRAATPVATSPFPAHVPDTVRAGLETLTPTERLVLQHLSLNKTSRQIARSLFVSVRTVQNHRARICEKLELRGPNALLGLAVELASFIGPPSP